MNERECLVTKKITIDRTEWYPVYVIGDWESAENSTEISSELMTRYENVMKEFEEVQDELETLYKTIY